MYHIDEIELTGFRGFPESGEQQPFSFSLSEHLNLIYGPHGVGKTSLLSSLEWVLFGKDITSVSKENIPRQRKHWEIQNRACSRETSVSIQLQGGSRALLLERTTDEVQIKQNDDLIEQQEPADLLGVDRYDYFTTVKLNQENIQNIVTATPSDRKESFYRLLGLSRVEQLIDLLEDWDKGDLSTSLLNQLDGAVEEKNSRIQYKEERIQQLLGEIPVPEEQCRNEEMLNQCRTMSDKLHTFAEDAGLDDPELGSYEQREEREVFFENVETCIKQFRKENPASKKLEQLHQFLRELEEFQNETKQIEKRQSRIEELLKKIRTRMDGETFRYGDPDDGPEEALSDRIHTFIEDTEEEIAALTASIEKENRQANLIGEARNYLQQVEKLESCPVCGNKETGKQSISDHLAKKEEGLAEETREKKNRKQNLQEKLKEAKEDVKQVKQQGKRRKKLKNHEQELRSSIESFLEEMNDLVGEEMNLPELDESTVLSKYAKVLKSSLETRREEVKEEAETADQKLDRIQNQLERLQKMDEVIKEKEAIEEIQAFYDTDAYQQAQELITEVSKQEHACAVLRNVLRTIREKTVRTRLEGARDQVDQLFSNITDRGYFPELGVTEDLSLVARQASEEVPLTAIHNHGDLNAAAISLFLGLSGQDFAQKALGTVLMDDPVRGMDRTYKEGLVRALEQLAGDRQVIISTNDPEFRDLFVEGVTKKSKLFTLSNWDAETGPTVEEQEV